MGDARSGARRVRTLRIEFSARSILGIAGVVVGFWLLAQLWQILLLLAVALVLAGTLSPLVDWLEQRRMSRPVALTLILLCLVVAIVGLGALVLPTLVSQVSKLLADAPALQQNLANVLSRFPLLSGEAAVIRTTTPEQLLAPVGSHAVAYAGTVLEVIVLGLTTAVLAFYILADRERVQGFAFALLPREYHVRVARILLDMENVVGGYIRGQALTSVLIGIFVFIVLAIVGTPSALALAAFAAFTDLIPFVGGVLALTPAVLLTLPLGVGKAVIVFVAIVLYQQVESHLLIPRVYGQTLRLSAVAVTVALLVGGTLLGVIGALLALPVAAGIRVLVQDLRIDLPGEQPEEEEERRQADRAEAVYARRTEGASATDAAAVATALAEQLSEEQPVT